MIKKLVVLLIAGLIALAAWQLTRPPAESEYAVQIIAPDAELPNLGFQTIQDEVNFDSAIEPHPEYQYERWQLDLSACFDTSPAMITFDRIGLVASTFAPERESAWAFQQVIIADVQLPDFQQTRYSRSTLGLAGANEDRIWLEDWSLVWTDSTYTLTIGNQANFTFLAESPPQTQKSETYYLIEQVLQVENLTCGANLSHSFGERLP